MRLESLFLIFFICIFSLNSHALCTVKDGAMMYRDKGKTPAWKVAKHMPLKLLKTDKKWTQVKAMDGYRYWIASQNVSKRNIQCVAVKVNKVNLRVGPGVKKSLHKFRIADKYTTFKVVLQKNSWLFVESHLGFKAWVVKSAVWPTIK